jgi:flagellar biogenesis protein FliO
MFVAVGVVILLIYLSVMFLKRMSVGRSGRFGAAGSLEVLERCYFAPKSFMCIARVGEKTVVLGVTETNVNFLADVSDQDFSSKVAEKRSVKGKSFKTYLNQARAHLMSLSAKPG